MIWLLFIAYNKKIQIYKGLYFIAAFLTSTVFYPTRLQTDMKMKVYSARV